MTDDSANERVRQLPVPSQQQLLDYVTQRSQALVPPIQRRGKPASLRALHLCLGIVLCGLRGFGAQLGLWRLLCMEPLGPFAKQIAKDEKRPLLPDDIERPRNRTVLTITARHAHQCRRLSSEKQASCY